MLILCTLAKNGSLRFSALMTHVDDISRRMLSQRLRRLEQDGFVTRAVYPTNPPRVEYALTALGKSLVEPLLELVQWARRNQRHVLQARRHAG